MNERSRIEEAFEQALEQDVMARSQFLEAIREANPQVAAEVEQLLRAHDRSAGILDGVGRKAPRMPERRIGTYRVVTELGRGGMGVVYLAERDDGQFRRRVAVKILSGGPDAEELRQRFQAERQILATLDHPNIAQLIDGGVTDEGLPYLVMEYVDGLPITDYCDRNRLGVRDRLRLFIDVCAAVHHAHRNLIIHRDLKPSNVLVTHDGQVKLLDFGIAKLLNPGLSAIAAPVTRQSERILTPEYASPEQLRGEPLSTTSDVYALGIVLHELLTGVRPEPNTRPSSIAMRSGPAAAVRDASTDQLSRTLRGDVDAILGMALRPEPSRRYGSAELLAQDVDRYLQGLPVAARTGNRWYHARKFVRRHWLAAAAVVVAATSLSAAAAVALRERALAHRERDRTQQALLESERVTAFLIGLFQASDPAQLRGNALTAQDLLQRGRQQAEELREHPLVQARMFEVIGRVYHATAQYGEARGLFERALSIREAHLGTAHLDVASTLTDLAETLRYQSRHVEADAAARRAHAIRLRILGPRHPDVAESQLVEATAAVYLADLDRAADLQRRAVAILEGVAGRDSALAVALGNLGTTLARHGDYPEAERLLRRSIDINRSIRAEHPQLAGALLSLAYTLDEMPERASGADSLYRQGVAMRRRTLGPDHPMYAFALGDYAVFLNNAGRYSEALPAAEQHYALITSIFGPEHPNTTGAMTTYAYALAGLGRRQEAITLARRSLDLRLTRLGRLHNSTANAMSALATMLHDAGQTSEAMTFMADAITILRNNSGGAETGLVALAYLELARFQLDQSRFIDAERSLLHALRIYQQARVPPTQKDHQRVLRALVRVYERWQKPEEANRYRTLLRSS
jgi:tetratricopeptide (TPR) repeat protein/predicted Ser/Thr protein kinase